MLREQDREIACTCHGEQLRGCGDCSSGCFCSMVSETSQRGRIERPHDTVRVTHLGERFVERIVREVDEISAGAQQAVEIGRPASGAVDDDGTAEIRNAAGIGREHHPCTACCRICVADRYN
ncbi:hypothetical protein ADL03_14480 [Nocardia sp. NRRL S-836]|nr:hypothetical protein ADL03_14480 [Nocardia sp. NRRL S-836]